MPITEATGAIVPVLFNEKARWEVRQFLTPWLTLLPREIIWISSYGVVQRFSRDHGGATMCSAFMQASEAKFPTTIWENNSMKWKVTHRHVVWVLYKVSLCLKALQPHRLEYRCFWCISFGMSHHRQIVSGKFGVEVGRNSPQSSPVVFHSPRKLKHSCCLTTRSNLPMKKAYLENPSADRREFLWFELSDYALAMPFYCWGLLW